ncbi:MAG: aminodeoxychorismate lyase [Waltera sp.]
MLSKCYDYGYRIFTEPAVSPREGRKVTVTLTSDMSATEIGTVTLQEKGSGKRCANCLHLQYLLSEYKKEWKPGTYELSTAMTAEEMMEVMAGQTENPAEESVETIDNGSAVTGDTQQETVVQ